MKSFREAKKKKIKNLDKTLLEPISEIDRIRKYFEMDSYLRMDVTWI